MADGQLRALISRMRRQSGCTTSDAQLLDDFVARRDDASFEVLVWRHGALVLSLCQRILHDVHEAEDAFQATFLVFARKAGSITEARIEAEYEGKSAPDKNGLSALAEAAEQKVRSLTGVRMKVSLVPPDTFPRAALKARRVAAVEFLANALFTDRAHGAVLASRVLREMPMPHIKDFQFRRKSK